LQILNSQYNPPPFPKKLSFAANRSELAVAGRFAKPGVQKSAAANLAVIDRLDQQIAELDLYLRRAAKVDGVQADHRPQTIPGVGKVLALVLLYEVHDIKRFTTVGQVLSYGRLVRCTHESAGKVPGPGGHKIGNAQLHWAFAEAACLFLRLSERATKWKQKHEKNRGEGKALAILAARPARAVYHLWRKAEAFDEARFWRGQPVVAKRRGAYRRYYGFLFSVPGGRPAGESGQAALTPKGCLVRPRGCHRCRKSRRGGRA
jgi:transposase